MHREYYDQIGILPVLANSLADYRFIAIVFSFLLFLVRFIDFFPSNVHMFVEWRIVVYKYQDKKEYDSSCLD